ncbi:proline transporter, partial [Genlisea aurea]
PGWGKYLVGPLQLGTCYGAVIALILLGGQSLKYIYLVGWPEDGRLKLYHFIAIFGGLALIMAQMPSFHSLRHINLVSLLLSLAYCACITVGAVYVGKRYSKDERKRDYSIAGTSIDRIFGVFNAISIVATNYGNGIVPEIQATVSAPVTGKMVKGLILCYGVVIATFFSVAISGYWAFGKDSQQSVLSNFLQQNGKPLLPKWLLVTTNVFTLLQLTAVTLVYLQPTNVVLENQLSDPKKGQFSTRNVVPRLISRSLSVIVATSLAAMLPFFGDMMALFGAFGVIPLDFILPMIFYNVTFKNSARRSVYRVNAAIVAVSVVLVSVGAVASVRQIVLDSKTYKLFANM